MYEQLRSQAQAAPDLCGVYFFRAADGRALYIGKAKSLRRRLLSHLAHPATRGGVRLLDKSTHLDYIICDNEWQALLLEQELVHAQQPTFNVALRSGRRYPRIAVSLDEEFPRVYATSERPRAGRRYFGPYGGEGAAALVELLARLYPFRSCDGTAPGRASGSPCLDFFMHRCEAPCVGYVSAGAYRRHIDTVLAVLGGEWESPTHELEVRMRAAAARGHFEAAARWRDAFLRLQRLCGYDSSATLRTRTVDALALTTDDAGSAQVQLLRVREGVLAGREHFVLDRTASLTPTELLREALLITYAQTSPAPLVLLAEQPEDALLLTRWLSERRGQRVILRVPRRGELVSLLDLAQRNAAAALVRASLANTVA